MCVYIYIYIYILKLRPVDTNLPEDQLCETHSREFLPVFILFYT